MNWINLTVAENRLAEFLGAQRFALLQARRRDNWKGPPRTVEDVTEGVAGELAVCRLLNVYPDLTLEGRSTVFDLIYHHATFDVKTMSKLNGDMLININKKDAERPDGYIAVFGARGAYHVAGWCWSGTAWFDVFRGDLGHGPVQRVPQKYLKLMYTLTEAGMRQTQLPNPAVLRECVSA